MNESGKNINIDIKASVDGAGFSAGVAQTERVSEAMKRAEYAAGQASMSMQTNWAAEQRAINARAQAMMDSTAKINDQAAAMGGASKDVQRLLDKYDPLGTKLRSLQADFANLNKAAMSGQLGGGQDAAVDKTYAALNAEIEKTKVLMGQAGVAADGQAVSMSGLGLNTQYARRELMQLGKEALTGDFSHMPNTFASLVTHSNLLSAAISPIGLAVAGVSAVLIAGAVAWNHWETVSVESADAVIKAIDAEYDARAALAEMTETSINKKIKLLDSELVAQRAYAADMSHKTTRFNWRSSAEELTKFNAAIEKNNMLRGQLVAQQPIAESESALKANLADNKKAQDAARREEQTAARKAAADAQSEAKRTAAYIAGIDKDRLYATIAEDKAGRIAHSQFLLTMELGRIKDTAQAEKDANQETATAAIREYMRRGEASAESNAAYAAQQKEADKAHTELWKSIDQTAHDTFVSVANGNKDMWSRMKESGKNIFFDWLYSMTAKKWLVSISAGFTGTAAASGMDAVGAGSDLLGLASMGSSIASFGSSVATGFSLSATAATTAAEAYSLAGMGATSFGLQLGNMAAAIPGWGWAIAGGLALAGLLSGNGGTPTASTGHAVIDYDAAGKQLGYQSLYGVQNAATDATAAGMNASYRNIANSLGIGTVATRFGYAGNTGENGQKPMFGLNGGAVGGPQFVQGETAYSEAAMGEAASRAVFAALQGSNLPGYLAGVFNGLDASKMSGQDISNTLAFAGALKQVRDGLTETVTPISAAQDALDKIGTTAASFTADFVAAIDAGMTPEKLAQWQAAGAALGSLGDMSLTMSAAVPQLTQTTWEMWNTQTTSVRGLISTFDGSVAATYALSAATKERYATEQQLVDQISGAMSSLGAMFAGSAEQMQLSVMDAQAKSNYFVDQANSLQLQMEAATDPAKIEDLAKQYNDASNNAWANLDNTQRTIMLDSYLENTEQVNTLVQDKLGRTLDEITRDSKNELPALIAQAVENAMTAFVAAQQAVADAQAAAANTIQSAANTMQAVADKPVNVKVDVDFNANVPGSSQVAVLP